MCLFFMKESKMRESLDEPVSVVMYYDAHKKKSRPYRMVWRGKEYALDKVDFWHMTTVGHEKIHHFSLCDIQKTVYVKLALKTNSLQWVLEEYMSAGDDTVQYGRGDDTNYPT